MAKQEPKSVAAFYQASSTNRKAKFLLLCSELIDAVERREMTHQEASYMICGAVQFDDINEDSRLVRFRSSLANWSCRSQNGPPN